MRLAGRGLVARLWALLLLLALLVGLLLASSSSVTRDAVAALPLGRCQVESSSSSAPQTPNCQQSHQDMQQAAEKAPKVGVDGVMQLKVDSHSADGWM